MGPSVDKHTGVSAFVHRRAPIGAVVSLPLVPCGGGVVSGFFIIPDITCALYMGIEGAYPFLFISTCVAIIGLLFDVANITLLFVGARFGAHFIGKRERV